MENIEKKITPEIAEELMKIQAFLSQEEQITEDTDLLIERLSYINAYMARTNFLLAEAKADLDAATKKVFAEYFNQILKMPATVSQKFISALCKEENYYATLIERINKTCVHQGDNIRTLVSYAKENMALTRRGY